MKQFIINDFGNEYIIYRDGEEICTCYSPEDAERTASLMFQLEQAKDALRHIAADTPAAYSADALAPDLLCETVQDVARHVLAMVSDYDGGMWEWDLPCPECGGDGCKTCEYTGSHRAMFHPSFQRPKEQS